MIIYTSPCRYHERYYPENIYNDDRPDYEDERTPVRHQVSIRVEFLLNACYQKIRISMRIIFQIKIFFLPFFLYKTAKTRYQNSERLPATTTERLSFTR